MYQSSVFHRWIHVFCWWKIAHRGRKCNSTYFCNIPGSISVSDECICRPSKCRFNTDLTLVTRHNLRREMCWHVIGLSERRGCISRVRGPWESFLGNISPFHKLILVKEFSTSSLIHTCISHSRKSELLDISASVEANGIHFTIVISFVHMV